MIGLRFYIYGNRVKAINEVLATVAEAEEIPKEAFDMESGAKEV